MYETANLHVCVLSPNLLILWIVNKNYSRNNLRDFLKSWRNVKYRTSKNIKLQQILHFVQSLDKEIGVFDIVIFINPSDYLFIYLSNLALASYFNTLIRSKFNHATLYHTWISIWLVRDVHLSYNKDSPVSVSTTAGTGRLFVLGSLRSSASLWFWSRFISLSE